MKQWGRVWIVLLATLGPLWAREQPALRWQEPGALVLQAERRTVADSLPREHRIQGIREANGEHFLIVELASEQRRLEIAVYNLLGKRVATVYQGKASPGVHEYPIPSAELPNGVYICVVQGDGFRLAQKFVVAH
jgi:hypothetical protein